MMPVYGLAESTVGLTVPKLGRPYIIDKVDRKAFEEQQIAVPSTSKQPLEFVSSGSPLEDHEVRIVDDSNQVLPDRHVGTLQFRGHRICRDYFNNPAATRAVFHDGWIDSGDLAYLVDGDLY